MVSCKMGIEIQPQSLTELSPFRSAASLSSRQLSVLTCPIKQHWIIRGQRTYCSWV